MLLKKSSSAPRPGRECAGPAAESTERSSLRAAGLAAEMRAVGPLGGEILSGWCLGGRGGELFKDLDVVQVLRALAVVSIDQLSSS
jgi:hypothetical protein